tara:strand:- start:662 stop:1411 length:750 start_codon:yes stop_codon:yes gene_type:complete
MKVLISTGKAVIVDGKERVIAKPRTYYVEEDADFHCEEGVITKEDLAKKELTSSKGVHFYCFAATPRDKRERMQRVAQWITLKDASFILAECGLHKESVVIEGGSGSGGLTCFLAQHVKHIHSYDIKEEHLMIAKSNVELLQLENVTFHHRDITKNKEEADTVILDVPEPWKSLHVTKHLKQGGFLVAYTPSTTQVEAFVASVRKKKELFHLKTIELSERKWKVKDKAVRPVSEGIGHTAFLTFVRKLA